MSRARALRHYFEQYFEPYQILKVPSPIRRTRDSLQGNYEPLLMGARTPSARIRDAALRSAAGSPHRGLWHHSIRSSRARPFVGRLEGNRVLPYYTRAELPTDAGPSGQGDRVDQQCA